MHYDYPIYDKKDNQILRISVSDIPGITGHNPYFQVIDKFQAYLYQDLQSLLELDAANLGLTIVTREQEVQEVLDKLPIQEKILLEAITNNKDFISSSIGTSTLSKDIKSILEKDSVKAVVNATQLKFLQSELVSGVQTSYGKHNEESVLDIYERMTNFSVANRNEKLLIWSIGPKTEDLGMRDVRLEPSVRKFRFEASTARDHYSSAIASPLNLHHIIQIALRPNVLSNIRKKREEKNRANSTSKLSSSNSRVVGLRYKRHIYWNGYGSYSNDITGCSNGNGETVLSAVIVDIVHVVLGLVEAVVERVSYDETVSNHFLPEVSKLLRCAVRRRREESVIVVDLSSDDSQDNSSVGSPNKKLRQELVFQACISVVTSQLHFDLSQGLISASIPALIQSAVKQQQSPDHTLAHDNIIGNIGHYVSSFEIDTTVSAGENSDNQVSLWTFEPLSHSPVSYITESHAIVLQAEQALTASNAVSPTCCPAFYIVGLVDGISRQTLPTDVVSGDIHNVKVQETSSKYVDVLVEVKNRVNRISHPPPFYDLVQLCTYMIMCNCPVGDLVQAISNKVSAAESTATFSTFLPPKKVTINRQFLDGPPTFHRDNWKANVLPALHEFVDAITEFRRDDSLRYSWLLSADTERREMLSSRCPELVRHL